MLTIIAHFGLILPLPSPNFLINNSRFHKSQREKSGGPPTIGLFDTLEVNTSALTSTPPLSSATFQQPASSHQSQHLSATNTPNRNSM